MTNFCTYSEMLISILKETDAPKQLILDIQSQRKCAMTSLNYAAPEVYEEVEKERKRVLRSLCETHIRKFNPTERWNSSVRIFFLSYE